MQTEWQLNLMSKSELQLLAAAKPYPTEDEIDRARKSIGYYISKHPDMDRREGYRLNGLVYHMGDPDNPYLFRLEVRRSAFKQWQQGLEGWGQQLEKLPSVRLIRVEETNEKPHSSWYAYFTATAAGILEMEHWLTDHVWVGWKKE